MKTAEDIVEEINSARGDGEEHGLRNTAALLELLQAWPVCPLIHVAGTNGKGSVCAMLSRILTAAGYRTGLYSSPYLQTYSERIRINGKPITRELLAAYGGETLDAAGQLEKEQGIRNTPFSLGTALALHAFRREAAEIVILETGLGGRLDPTNVIPKPAVCAITAIGMDHMQLLGNTLQEIAREKAGIIKAGVPVVCYPADAESVREVITLRAAELNAPLRLLDREQVRVRYADEHGTTADIRTLNHDRKGLTISLPGEHQTLNALTALETLEALETKGIRIPEEAVSRGLADTFWPGRLEWFGNVLMDGAHNAQGVKALRSFTESCLAGRKKVLLTGVLKEKLTDEMLTGLRGLAEEAVTVTPDTQRAMSAEELGEMLSRKGMKTFAAKNLREGLAAARKRAGEDGTVLATGSLYFIGALRSELGLKP